MKHFNLKIQTLRPFLEEGEQLASGLVTYIDRTTNGTNSPMQCDWVEIGQMLRNRRYFENLYWLQVSFLVVRDGLTIRRTWRFVESAAGHHYWLDTDTGKWYRQDNWEDWNADPEIYDPDPEFWHGYAEALEEAGRIC